MEGSSHKKTQMAPCREACPAGIDVPRYIRHIRNKDFDRALMVIREKIPFPAVCGHACVHPCETKCARIQYDEGIAIRLLKRAAEEKGRDLQIVEPKARPTGKKVAIIGAGPCGLTAAYFLAGLGHAFSVFEALPRAGGMLRYGIPEYRLPNEVVDREIAWIQARGVEILTHSAVPSAPDLLARGYDAVLAATGAWKAVKADIEGEDSPLVQDGVAFLKEVNTGARGSLGRKVVVVGGGNTALDAARASVRLGAQTVLIYRRSREDMPALPEEVAEAEEEGVQIEFLTAPIRIDDGNLVCIRMEPGPLDDSGRPKPIPLEGSAFSLACDALIMAVGQTAQVETLQLEENRNGTAKVDVGLSTPVKGIFAAGDMVSGPKTIIEAIAQGRLASVSIDRYLGGAGRIDPEVPPEESPTIPEVKSRETYRLEPEKLPLKSRISGFGLVELGFDEETAVEEAKRCLACDIRQYTVEVNPAICKECGYCREMCQMDIFGASDHFNALGYKPSVVKNSDHCVGCLKCLYICPDFAITITEGKPDQGQEVSAGR